MVWWYIAVFIVALVAAYAMMPKPQSTPPAGLGDFNAPTAEEGREIPVLFGTRDINGSNVVWFGDLKVDPIRKKAGKSLSFKTKWQTVGYKYSLGMHQILCHGPVDFMSRYTVEERLAWSGFSSGGPITVSANSLFGGDDGQGGVSGRMDLEMGDPAQAPNDYLASKLGAPIPAFRGVIGIVQRQMYLGNSTYLKKNAFRLQRIHVRSGGEGQWYDAKAAVPSFLSEQDNAFKDFYGLMWALPCGAPAGATACEVSGTVTDTFVIGGNPSKTYTAKFRLRGIVELNPYTGGTSTDVPYVVKDPTGSSSPNTNRYTITVSDPPATYALNKGPLSTSNLTVLDYEFEIPINGGATVTLYATPVDSTQTSNNQDWEVPEDNLNFPLRVTQPYPGQFMQLDVLSETLGFDMNPAHIIRECLTDSVWGMGYTDEDIDDISFANAADALWSETMGMSLLWDRQQPIQQFIQEIVKHINAALYVARSGTVAGKFVLKLIRGGYDVNSLPLFNESNVKKVENFRRMEIGELTNSVTVNYWDASTGKSASTTAQDPALIQQQGAVINTTMQYPGFTNASLANRISLRDLQSLSNPLASGSLYVETEDAQDVNVGDVVAFSWDDYAIVLMALRVSAMGLGDDKNRLIKLTVSQDVFDMPQIGVLVPPDVTWENPNQPPQPIPRQYAEELPYFEMVQQFGLSETLAQLATNPGTGILGASGSSGQSGVTGAVMKTDAGAGYQEVDTIALCPSATLDGPVGRGDGSTTETWTLKEFIGLDSIVPGFYARVDSGDLAEYVYVESVDAPGASIDVKRGVLDSIPKEHADGTLVMFSDEFVELDAIAYLDGNTVDTILLTSTGGGVLSESDATPMSTVMASRAIRPYPPANVTLEDQYWVDGITFNTGVELKWVDRNRSQTDPVLIGWYDPGETLEAGVTYTVRNINAVTDVETYLETNAVSPLSISLGDLAFDNRLEIFSVRDGYESREKIQFRFFAGFDLTGGPDRPGYVNGETHSLAVAATGGAAPFTWSISAGALPGGWSLDGSTTDTVNIVGKLAGTAGTSYSFTVKVVDANGVEATKSFTIGVGAMTVLLHMDGSNGSTTFTNEVTGSSLSVSGNAQLTTSNKKFGTAAGTFDGTGDDVYINNDSGAIIAQATPYTISGWIYVTGNGGGMGLGSGLWAQCFNGSAGESGLMTTLSGVLSLVRNAGANGGINQSVSTAASTLPANQWVHVLESYDGTHIRVFVNGVKKLEVASTRGWNVISGQPLRFGRFLIPGFPAYAIQMQGQQDEIRVVRGVAEYVADFTPPSAASNYSP